ncbi:MAG: MFS transporter [Sphaerochaeta sp.]|jgi:MFS family permease|nr:MFS transporter [Sphaerochaeta sp.]MCI2076841.1 MFS transporter [Sphaerochaeta sp.]MCI2096343.1 MFS transporter [Sphaerochaeta sp.]
MIRFMVLLQTAVMAFSSNLFGGLGNDIQQTCGITLEGLGWILSLSQAGLIIAFLLYPALMRKEGPYRTMIIGTFGAAAGFFLLGASRTASFFAVAFLLQGVLGYPWSSAKFSVITFVDRTKRERNIATMHLIYAISSMFAGWYISRMKGSHWYQAYYQNGIAWLVLGFVFLSLLGKAKQTPDLMVHQGTEKNHLKDGFSLLAERPFRLFYLSLIISATVEGLTMIYPLLFLQQSLGSTAAAVGLAVTLFHVGMTGSRLLLIPFFIKSKRTWTIIGSLTALVAASLVAMSFATTVPMALVTLTVAGFGLGALNPMAQIVEIHSWPDRVDQVMNMHTISGTIGKLVLPVIVGAISTRISQAAGILSIAIMMLLSLVTLVLAKRALNA